MKTNHAFALILTLLFLANVPSCQDAGGPFTPPRIYPGESVDGARIGQSLSQVQGILGPADALGTWTGSPGGRLMWYTTGAHAGLEVWFENRYPVSNQDTSWGAVVWFIVRPPFAGRTDKGITIGSTRPQVHLAYLQPDDTSPNGEETYCFTKKYLTIAYDSTYKVNALFTGVADHPGQTCW
jgi:hypothetical protein